MNCGGTVRSPTFFVHGTYRLLEFIFVTLVRGNLLTNVINAAFIITGIEFIEIEMLIDGDVVLGCHKLLDS